MTNRFPTLVQAIRYTRALGGSNIYTAGGNPPLPRCDCPGCTGADVTGRGKVASCTCTSRTDVADDCPHVTRQHAEVLEVTGEFVVDTDPREAAVFGQTVRLDGADLVLNHAPSDRVLSRDEVTNARHRWPNGGRDGRTNRRRERR